EGGVDRRDGLCGVDDGFEDEVVDGILVAVGFLRLVVDLLAQRHERGGVGFEVQVEMRDGDLGGEKAGGDDFPHGGEFDPLVPFLRGGEDGLGGGSGGGGSRGG